MGYMSGKAAGRKIDFGADPAAPAISGEGAVRAIPQSSHFRQYGTAPANGVETGNYLRFTGNEKGTGTAGRPAAMAEASKDKVMAPVVNPDGVNNRP